MLEQRRKGKYGTLTVLTLLLKSNINHFHPHFISQSKCTARHDVNKAGSLTLPKGGETKGVGQ